MSREVRITIDDDEVFERMKRRKRQLDLSWEDVLHRGLRADQRPNQRERDATGGEHTGSGQGSPSRDHGPVDTDRGRSPGGHRAHASDEYAAQWDRFADHVEAQVQDKVYNALRGTFGAAGIDVPAPSSDHLDSEMADLARAEDAVLSFDFLDDDPAYQVPLRVALQTSTDGLDVEVVAVRQGKTVREMNHFDAEARLAVTTRLAAGDPAVLRFDDGAEAYAVDPIIRWERDDAGHPTVTQVDIEAVRLDGDDVE